MANVLSGIEIDNVTVDKLRDIGKLYNFEEELGIAEKAITELNNQKEVDGKEDVVEISLTQEEKKKGKGRFEEQNKKTEERN